MPVFAFSLLKILSIKHWVPSVDKVSSHLHGSLYLSNEINITFQVWIKQALICMDNYTSAMK